MHAHSGVTRGGRWGRSAPGGTFRGGGGKIEVILKNFKIWRGEKYKFWGMTLKSRGAANLRTAPGGRHPSYATACTG